VYAVIEVLVFCLQPGDRLLVLAALVGMAGRRLAIGEAPAAELRRRHDPRWL
jgi:hypothetical protein